MTRETREEKRKQIEKLSEEEQAFDEAMNLFYANQRRAIEWIKQLEDINFKGEIEGEDVIGYIDDHDGHIEVQYLEDNLGKYIALVLPVEKKNNALKASKSLSRWIVNGRHEILEDKNILRSIFPLLDERFIGKQMHHALLEIWDMKNIVRNTPKRANLSY